MFLFIIGALTAGPGRCRAPSISTNTRRRASPPSCRPSSACGSARRPAMRSRPRPSAASSSSACSPSGLHMALRLAVELGAHAPTHTQASRSAASPSCRSIARPASATCCRSSTPTSRGRPALDDYLGIDHELIRFDDVVAEYPGFEACTPAHIAQVLEFGERVHAEPGSHVLVHCHAGVSRSTAAAAILMCQHAPGQEEAAFLKLLRVAQARLAQHPHGRVRRPAARSATARCCGA